MAIARLSVKVGKAGKAAVHAAYIAREGQYAGRRERVEELEATEAGNMPAWARDNPLAFWDAADAYERKNGSTYREFEIALPRELDVEQRAALVRDWVRQELGDRHVYQWAIHTPTAVDGEEQPHVHVMFSERTLDGIERDPEQFFKRYNAKAPERGGCKKANTGLDRETRIEQLKELRGRWQEMCNLYLERAGTEARIDMRSYRERGMDLEPERKMLPSEWRQESRRAQIVEFRQARAEIEQSSKDLADLIPDMQAEIIDLQAERKRRAERPAPDPIQDLLGEAEALLNTGKKATAAKRPVPDALQELVNVDKRTGRRGVSVSRPEPARVPEKASAPVIPPKVPEPPAPTPSVPPPVPPPAQEPKKGPPAWLRKVRADEQRQRAERERDERDRATERETRPGIRHPDKPRWQIERERVLTQAYGDAVDKSLARWYRIEPRGDALVLTNTKATVTDHGDRVTAAAGNDREIKAMIALAKAKGWEKVSLTGAAEFQERAARAFVAAGFGLTDAQLEQRVRRAEQEREAADRARIIADLDRAAAWAEPIERAEKEREREAKDREHRQQQEKNRGKGIGG